LHQKYITTNLGYIGNGHACSIAATLAAAAAINFAHQHFFRGQLQHKTKVQVIDL
jgi:hypothetical protein